MYMNLYLLNDQYFHFFLNLIKSYLKINEVKNDIIKNDKIKMYFSNNNSDDVSNQKKGKKRKI